MISLEQTGLIRYEPSGYYARAAGVKTKKERKLTNLACLLEKKQQPRDAPHVASNDLSAAEVRLNEGESERVATEILGCSHEHGPFTILDVAGMGRNALSEYLIASCW